jgi:hypothetical protein
MVAVKDEQFSFEMVTDEAIDGVGRPAIKHLVMSVS